MSPLSLQRLNAFIPHLKVLPLKERILCGIGAFLGLALSSLISWWVLGGFNAWYIAPMGASSVLLFAVPASPLAQPWNIVIGNVIAAVVGVSCYYLIPNLTLAFSVAVALTIVLMMSTDSLHPPSGAVAITAVLGGADIHQLGYAFVFHPVLINSVALLLCAVVFNRWAGKNYPAKQLNKSQRVKPTPTQKVTIQPQDIHTALHNNSQLLDISEYDLQQIILDAQQQAFKRHGSCDYCHEIMTHHVVALKMTDTIQQAVAVFKQMNLMSLPVVNQDDLLVGTLALSDIIDEMSNPSERMLAWDQLVFQLMKRKVVTVKPEQPIDDLIPYFVERSFNYIPVVDHEQRMVGIISRADMIAALNYRLKS